MRRLALAGTVLIAFFFGLTPGNAGSQAAPLAPVKQAGPEPSRSGDVHSNTAGNEEKTQRSPILVQIVTPDKTEEEKEADRRERHDKAGLDRRLVELTGDLANFTAGLFYATVALALATAFLVGTAILQIRDLRRQGGVLDAQERMQRAFVVGGCGPTQLLTDVTGRPVRSAAGHPVILFHPGVRNFGKTAAWIMDVRAVLCPEPVPSRPDYSGAIPAVVSDSLAADGSFKPYDEPQRIPMEQETMIYYGRIRYLDVLRRERYAGFIYRLRNDGSHTRIHDAHPDYLYWN